jgi:hypothetical protein
LGLPALVSQEFQGQVDALDLAEPSFLSALLRRARRHELTTPDS